MPTGRVTLYIAASVDGYIAEYDGGVAWLDEFQPETGTGDDVDGYAAFFESVDCLVMGSTTYEQVRSFGEWPYEDRPTYVLTHRELPRAADTVEFVDGEVAALADHLKGQYDHIWVVGGATVVQAFLGADRIDELRLNLVPVLLGSGIPLFAARGERQRLALLGTTTYDSGIAELRYEVPGGDRSTR